MTCFFCFCKNDEKALDRRKITCEILEQGDIAIEDYKQKLLLSLEGKTDSRRPEWDVEFIANGMVRSGKEEILEKQCKK